MVTGQSCSNGRFTIEVCRLTRIGRIFNAIDPIISKCCHFALCANLEVHRCRVGHSPAGVGHCIGKQIRTVVVGIWRVSHSAVCINLQRPIGRA